MIAKPTKTVVGVLDPYHPDAIERLQNDEAVKLLLPQDSKDRILAESDAVILRSETRLGAADFEKCKNVKYIVKQGVGVDNIDLDAAREAGIRVYNTPGLNGEAVAETTLSLALCLARRISEIDRAIRTGQTVIRSQTLGRSLYKKTLGIVGMGNIGHELARKWLGAMSGKIVAYDPYYKGKPWPSILSGDVKQVHELDELLKEADVVSLHVPLTPSTKKMISDDQFAIMKRDAILLNCARGGIVDEEALVRALDQGRLAGVGLDAMEIEPPTASQYASLLSHENVIITPHIGASTIENQSRSGLAVVELALDLLQGREVGNRLV